MNQQRFPTRMPVAIFLDSGGVINDNKLRAPQWVHHLGEFLPTTVLGGTPEIWSFANAEIVKTFFSRWDEYMIQATKSAAAALAEAQAKDGTIDLATTEDRSLNVYWIFERIQLLAWIKAMIDVALDKVPGLVEDILPGLTDNDLFALARSAHLYTLPKVKADFPGAVDTIRALGRFPPLRDQEEKKRLFKLYTSSGDSIEDLEYILGGLGVLECFDGLYGADRINCLKSSPLYYERVFAHVGLRVKKREISSNEEEEKEELCDEVVVVDDSIKALRWARGQGARTVLISDKEDLDLSQEGYGHIDYHLKSLSDLPALLESWRVQLEP